MIAALSCNRSASVGVNPTDQMIANTAESTGAQKTTPIANALVDRETLPTPEQKDSFETFETDFFQAGEDHANLQAASERQAEFDDGRRGPHAWLSRPSLLSLTALSTALALSACIALWRSNAPIPALPRVVAQGTEPAPPARPPPPMADVENDHAATEQAATDRAANAPAATEVVLAAGEPGTAVTPPASNAAERCRTSIREKHNKEILAACPAALAGGADDADIAVALARVEFERGRISRAHTWSKRAIAINPDAAEAYVFAGGAEQSRGHDRAAKDAYLRYLKLAPSGRYAAELRAIVRSL